MHKPQISTRSTSSLTNNQQKAVTHTFFDTPTLGSIVWSYFPNEEVPADSERPARPKPRPALVVGVTVEDGKPYVIAIPGTSKRTEPGNIYPTEIVIRKTDPDYVFTGLSHDTKFKFERRLTLPYSSEYFAIPNRKPGSKENPTTPRLGIISWSYVEAIRQAAAIAKGQIN